MILADLLNETVHDIQEEFYDRLGLSEEERKRERARFGLCLIAHAVELMEDIEGEYEGEIQW